MKRQNHEQMDRSFVSIIITSFNEARFLSDAIDSVLSQTRSPDEIILVDAGSSDGTQEIIRRYTANYPIIQSYFMNENTNIPEMRNFGLDKASGELITFLDGDDRFREKKLEKEIELILSNSDVEVVFSNVVYINEHDEEIKTWSTSNDLPSGNVLFENLMRDWPRGSLYRDELMTADLINKIGGYDEQLPIYEDWDFKIRTAANTNVGYCSDILTEYRQHERGISTRSSHEVYRDATMRVFENNESIIENHLDKSEERKVKRFMKSKIHKHDSFASAEVGADIDALSKYLQSIKANPSTITKYRTHLRFLLPRSVYKVLRRIYRLVQPQQDK